MSKTVKIGLNKADEVADAVKNFCDIMEMNQEQKDSFKKLMCTLMSYTATTVVDTANCVMGTLIR